MEDWSSYCTCVMAKAAYFDNEETPYRVRFGRAEDDDAEDEWAADDPAAAADLPEPNVEAVDGNLAVELEQLAARVDLAEAPPSAAVGDIPHGRGRIVVEARSIATCPSASELQRTRAFCYDMREEWCTADRAARACIEQGHTGQSGVILRGIAFHECWGAVVAAARRACNRAWWRQIMKRGALEHGFDELRLTLICSNGLHRSVAAAYLLAAALEQVEGAAAAEVWVHDCAKPCGCPGECELHFRERDYAEAQVHNAHAIAWTIQLMRADAQAMPWERLKPRH